MSITSIADVIAQTDDLRTFIDPATVRQLKKTSPMFDNTVFKEIGYAETAASVIEQLMRYVPLPAAHHNQQQLGW